MKKVTKINGKTTEIFYPSITDVLADVKSLRDDRSELYRSATGRKVEGFNCFEFSEAIEVLVGGKWQTGIEQLNKAFTTEVKALDESKHQKMFYDIVGYQASVPRYLQGLPTNMINSRRTPKTEKVLTIVKHIGFRGDITTDEIISNSAKALCILQQIEKRGIRCNLDIYSPATDEYSGKKGIIRIRIKNATERLSIGQLAFPLANPDMLRRIIFALRRVNVQDSTWSVFSDSFVAGSSIYDVDENITNVKKCCGNVIFLNNFIKSPEEELKRNGMI